MGLGNSGQNAGDTPGDNDLALSPGIAPVTISSWTVTELLAETFPEPRWAIPGLLPEGLTLLAGAPKVGKSWLALDLHLAVSSGGKALGAIDVEAGPSLYLALEDNPRRLQSRVRKCLAGAEPPKGLVLAIDCPPFPEGLRQIEKWLKREREPRLITIDVLERVRGPVLPGQSAYSADYAAMRSAKQLADAYGVALVLIHHLRKVTSADFLSEISGTLGMPGAADTIIALKRSRGEADGLLQITGRDVEENEFALRFDAQLGAWQLLGLAADLDITDTRRAILAYVRDHPGDKPAAVALGTGLGRDLVKQTVTRMTRDGQLDTDGQGRYFPPVPIAAEET
jgi:RecA-family ATPase